MAAEPGRFAISDESRYGIVLLVLVCAVVATIVWPAGSFSAVLTAGLEGAAVLVAIGGRRGRGVRLALLAAVLLSLAVTALARGSLISGIRDLINAAVIVALPVIIAARFRRSLLVNVQTVLGAVCIYLVIGMLYASLDSGFSHLSRQPYFAGVSSATSSEYMYFSFITLTTVGYGDLTPGPGTARALAVVEALMGQLYLVTVIALLVGNFGSSRQPRRPGSAANG